MRGKPIEQHDIDMMRYLRDKKGKTNKEIATALNFDPKTIENYIGSDKKGTNDLQLVLNKLDQIQDTTNFLIDLLEITDGDGYIRSRGFEEIGFKEQQGTYIKGNIQVNMNNKMIFYKDFSNSKNGQPIFISIEPEIIEAIWNEMIKRGWNYYKK